MAHGTDSPNKRALVKIVIDLPHDAPTREESLWARSLGDRLYRLDNTPWYATGCALGDVVECEDRPGQLPRLVRVVQRSGNRTIRVFIPDSPNRSAVKVEVFRILQAAACPFEEYGTDKGLIAATVPPSIAADSLFRRLDELEAEGGAYWEAGNF